MGADGGVVYICLKHPSDENCTRALELLKPFWQFLSRDGGADWAENANYNWEQENPEIGFPSQVVGYYGTDRVDSFNLGDLPEVCEVFEDYRGNLFALTFDELDMDCRTSITPITGKYHEHPLHRLWYQHFHFYSREEVLKQLGVLASMKIEDWAKEIQSLLELSAVVYEETWT